MTGDIEALEALDLGFRARYLDFETLSQQLRAWASAFPAIARLESLGVTPLGRDLWLLTIGSEPDRVRPAVWVDGNLHASELAGSSVALAIAEDAIRLHLTSGEAPLFYVMPRISPDGAEAVLRDGGYVRSVPRDTRLSRQHPRWRPADVDGDGLALAMRVEDRGGEYVESAHCPGLMVERTPQDAGPFYKVYPEGVIEHFDGHTVPDPGFLDDNAPDLNRNFPFAWVPEPEQAGAGPFPGSEPESRAIVEFAVAHPNIFAWLNLHTFGGVYIRPRQDVPDAEMDRSDLALYRQLEAWTAELTGYPMVSGFEEFTYEPGKPLHGDLCDFAYHQRGCLALVCELWDLFRELGIERRTPFVDHYTHTSIEDLERLARWDREHNGARVVRPWRRAEHPQLGEVEVGGWDPRVGVSNPPYERLPGICASQSAFWCRVAGMLPRVDIETVDVEPLGNGVSRVDASVINLGYLPTHGLASARARDWNEPLHVDIDPRGCALVDPADRHRSIGHLDGWGRGLYSGAGSLFFRYSRGSGHRARVTATLRGHGTVSIRVGSCRVGWIEREVSVGDGDA